MPALESVAKKFIGINNTVTLMNNNLSRFTKIAGSAAGILVGVGVIKGLTDIAKHGEKLLDQQTKLINVGRTQAEVTNLTAGAFERITKAVPTAAAADVLRITNELTSVLGNFEKARAEAPAALKLEALMGNLTGKSGEGQGQAIYRALEEKLVTQDPEHMHKLRDLIWQGAAATGGKVNGTDVQTYARRAGLSWIKASDEYVKNYLPTIIQSVGAETAGTAMQTMYMAITGTGTLSKQQFLAFKAAHMIDESKITTDKGGRVNMQPGAILGQEYSNNPAEWARKVLGPHLDQFVPEKEREAVVNSMGRNRNTMRMFETFTNPLGLAQFDRDAALRDKVLPIDQSYGNLTNKNPKGVIEAYNKQLDSMLSAMGGPLMQAAIPVMKSLTDAFNAIGAFASQHGEAIKTIGTGFAFLGAALTAGGAAAILAALGPAGWITVGLVTGIGILAVALPKIGTAINGAIDGAINMINAAATRISDAVINFAKSIAGSFHIPSGGRGDAGTQEFGRALGGAGAAPMRWTPPPGGGRPVVIHTNLVVDGRKMAQATTRHIVALAGGPTEGSVYPDGTSGNERNDAFRIFA
jgi:hypothetical protein